MVTPTKCWSFATRKQLTQWYGHVHLLKNRVVGQWFALDRTSGASLWEKSFRRANSIFEITDKVILATETRSDGPWTMSFGCAGISIENGDLLWRWYGRGLWGNFVELLDWVPGFTNDLRTGFVGARESQCVTARGDVLDIHTGRLLAREADTTRWKKDFAPQTPAQKIFYGLPVEISEGQWLSLREGMLKVHKLPNGVQISEFPQRKLPFGFVLRDSSGRVLWNWGPEETGLNPALNFYGWRLVGKQLLILGGEQPATVPIDPKKPLIVRPNPTKYHLLIVDALTGQVSQRMAVGDERMISCRIEDADDDGFLLSHENKTLFYFSLHHGES